MGGNLNWPTLSCVCRADGGECLCPTEERALRGWIARKELPPMTAEQRDYCLDEIGSVEGYVRSEHEEEDDAQLASSTLGAWTDYCRDKGLM